MDRPSEASSTAVPYSGDLPTKPDPGNGLLRILLVEDVETDAELIKAVLRRAGVRFAARRVDNGNDYVRELDAFEPDLIIADYSLPQFDALQALALLRQRPAQVPVILVTGTQTEEIAVQCIKEGAEDYILKERMARLPSAVEKALKSHAAEAEKERARAKLQEAQLQLIQAEKMESVGRLAAGVAHEVKNPLTVLMLGVEHLRNRFADADGELLTLLQDMEASAHRAHRVIRGLLDFSMPGELDARSESLDSIVQTSLDLMKHEFVRSGIQIETDFADSLPTLHLDRNKIEQVFVNLLMNAAHVMESGGTLRVRTHVIRDHAGRSMVVAEIEDSGPGIPAEKLKRVFEPFFSTKPTGKGTGLGLTVVRKIVELHGGSVALRNSTSGGAVASVAFVAGDS